MVTVVAEGVDYSSTANADWNGLAAAFVKAGKTFAGRYAVYDKSPDERGITNAEYVALKSHGVSTFLYYEEDAGWMTGGWSAGVRAGTRALDVVSTEKMPLAMPVYYSDDIPPEEDDFNAVVQCLKGATSVVGFERTAFYGGWDAIDHVMGANAASKYCQTLAWQYGRGLHPNIHLHQYGFNQYIFGTNCDFVAALQPHFGQSTDYDHPSKPTYAAPIKPPLKDGKPYAHLDAYGVVWLLASPTRWKALKQCARKQRASNSAEIVGPPIKAGDTVTFIYSVSMPDGSVWFISANGSRCDATAFVPIG